MGWLRSPVSKTKSSNKNFSKLEMLTNSCQILHGKTKIHEIMGRMKVANWLPLKEGDYPGLTREGTVSPQASLKVEERGRKVSVSASRGMWARFYWTSLALRTEEGGGSVHRRPLTPVVEKGNHNKTLLLRDPTEDSLVCLLILTWLELHRTSASSTVQ